MSNCSLSCRGNCKLDDVGHSCSVHNGRGYDSLPEMIVMLSTVGHRSPFEVCPVLTITPRLLTAVLKAIGFSNGNGLCRIANDV